MEELRSPCRVRLPNTMSSSLLFLVSREEPLVVNALLLISAFSLKVRLLLPTLTEFCVMYELRVILPVVSMIPFSPEILLLRVPSPNFTVPLLVISESILRLLAEITIVPAFISRLVCVSAFSNVTLPVASIMVSPEPSTSSWKIISLAPARLSSPSLIILLPNSVLLVEASTFNVPLLSIPVPLKLVQANTFSRVNVSSSSMVTPPKPLPSTVLPYPLTVRVALVPSIVPRSRLTSSVPAIVYILSCAVICIAEYKSL